MVKFIVGIVIGALVIVFILTNAEIVDLRLYFWTVRISRAIMLLIVLGTGMVVGYILNGVRISKMRK
ncbi:MAG TPA: LapA family protein [Sediminispirochaeta sp.]|nr:LapA family protein [Sediminispirochaeta sp.]